MLLGRPVRTREVPLSDIITLWIGDSLGAIERACLRSMLRQGHRVALYCYTEVAGVPPAVELRDASRILPRAAIPQSWSDRSDLYSDWFRYLIQKAGLGTWLDLDVYLLAPIDMERAYLFGEYAPRKINGAVLRLPADSPILDALLKQFETGAVPIGPLPLLTQVPTLYRKLTMGISHLAKTPFGATGPFALTGFAGRFGVSDEALPQEVFYPTPWRNAAWIVDPAIRVEDQITDRTVAVHLWNECIRGYKHSQAPEGSFLERLQREGRL